MITSDRQLHVTKKKIEELKKSLAATPRKEINAILKKAANAQTQALIEELNAQIKEYEDLQSLGVKAIQFLSLEDVFLLPIKYRIAKHLSQEAFSDLVGVALRQIARYEADGYKNIQGDTLKKILSKLPVSLSRIEIKEKKTAI